MDINPVNVGMPMMPPVVEEETTINPQPTADQVAQIKVMEKLIRIFAKLQSTLEDASFEVNRDKARATRQMMRAYKEMTKAIQWQASIAGAGSAAGGAAIFTNQDAIKELAQIALPMLKESPQKYFEGTQRSWEGQQRQFEQLGQDLGQLNQSIQQLKDSLSDKISAASNKAAPGA